MSKGLQNISCFSLVHFCCVLVMRFQEIVTNADNTFKNFITKCKDINFHKSQFVQV